MTVKLQDPRITESWRPAVGFEGYEVSDQGRVRSLVRLRQVTRGAQTFVRRYGKDGILKGSEERGYARVNLHGSHVQVHRLVAATFIGPCPEGMEVCHNNGDSTDNRLSNLRYDTRSANHFDAVMHGTHPQASKSHCPRGHEYTPTNTYRNPTTGHRVCRACMKLRPSYPWGKP